MYFYIHKIYKHENEQAQLLEVCGNACINFRNGGCNEHLIKNTKSMYGLWIEISATLFYFKNFEQWITNNIGKMYLLLKPQMR